MSVAGARRGSTRMVESGVGALYLTTALMTVASGIIVHAFVVGDYSIKYVQRYSDLEQPLFYKITSYWGGLDGSILFWVFLLSMFGALAVATNRERHRELIPYVVAIISVVEAFFLFLMIIHRNPFDTFLTATPAEGRGLNPLLQNPYMVIHPPSLYIGFVGMTIPYAFGMAALITGYLDDAWLRAVRRWTMVSWLFLTFGLTLGMIWAYEELGWGGYWGWDPVENAGLLPWFTATAFLHSVIVQERRSMLRVWNVTLVIVTFLLTIFGTFMTRSGIVQSVHAFGEDRELAWMFTAFMAAIVTFSFGWVIYRLPLLRSRHELDSWLSREAAFLANNWILLFCALFVLFATMFPTLSEAVTGERLTVGPPFFNKWMAPIGLMLLFLTGTAPLLAWRKSTMGNLREQFMWPVFGPGRVRRAGGVGRARLVVGDLLCAVRVRDRDARAGSMARRAHPAGGHGHRRLHGRRRSGRPQQAPLRRLHRPPRHRADLLRLCRRRVQAGRAGAAQARAAGHRRALHGAARLDSGDRRRAEADDHGAPHGVRGRRRDRQDVPGQVVLPEAGGGADDGSRHPPRRSAEDVYIVLPAFDLKDQSASLHVVVNPLVNWIWLGFGIMAIGTGIALLPERAYSFAVARAPEGTATSTVALLLVVALTGLPFAAPVHAQHSDTPQGSIVVRTPQERKIAGKLACWCGGCARLPVGTCLCPHCEKVRDRVSVLLKTGHDARSRSSSSS